MNRISRMLAAGLVAAGAVVGVTSGAFADSGVTTLALGDSLAVGVGASDAETTGYPAHVASAIEVQGGRPVEVINLAVSGETTVSMREPDGQLDEAVELLEERNGDADDDDNGDDDGDDADDIDLITIDIGGNDVFALVGSCAAGLSPACQADVMSTFATVTENLNVIYAALREAAGPQTAIVVMTYANTLVNPDCELHAQRTIGAVVLEGEAALGLPAGLNDVIRRVAAQHDILVAEGTDLDDPAFFQADCLHYTDAGYAAVGERFEDVIPFGTVAPPAALPSAGNGGLADEDEDENEDGSGPNTALAAILGSVAALGVVSFSVARRAARSTD